MHLTRKDIDKIQEVLDKFPEVEIFELDQDSSSGIGSVTTMTFPLDAGGLQGSFNIEISGVEDW